MIYFAYGLLVNRDRLLALSPNAEPLHVARIAHHALCFTGRSADWGGGVATIGLAPKRDLWGALYRIDDAGRAAIERSRGPEGYVWTFSDVLDSRGERVESGMLVKVRDFEPNPPSDAYLEVLRAGWEQWGLDPAALLHDIALAV